MTGWDDPDADPLGDVRRMAARAGGTSWTIGDALRFLDPAPPRRTLSRWLSAMTSDGEARLPQGGPPARTYPAQDVMVRHARWVTRVRSGMEDL